MTAPTEDQLYELFKKRISFYYTSAFYDNFKYERERFDTYWGKASQVERYMVEKFLRCGFTEVLARQTYDRNKGGPLTPRSDFSFITVENYPELKQLHEEAESARNRHNNHVFAKFSNYLDRIYFLTGLLKHNSIDAEYIEDVKKFIAYEERILYLRNNECFEFSKKRLEYDKELEKLRNEYEKEFERTHPGFKEEYDEAWQIEFRHRGSCATSTVLRKYNYKPYVPERDVIEKTTTIFFPVFKSYLKKVVEYQKSIGNYYNCCRAILRVLEEHYQFQYGPDEDIIKENTYVFKFKQIFDIDISDFREAEKKAAPAPVPSASSTAKKTASKPRKKKETPKPEESAPTVSAVSEAPKVEQVATPAKVEQTAKSEKSAIPTKDEVRKYCLISNGILRDFTGKMDYVDLPDEITIVRGGAFKRVKDTLRVVIISDGVTEIQASTFADCPNLEEVRLPESITYIYDKAFINCKKLKKINFPSSLIRIHSYAFNGCDSLKSADLPKDCFVGCNPSMMPFPQGCIVKIGGVVTDANIVEYTEEVAKEDDKPSVASLITAKAIADSKENLLMSSTVLRGIQTNMECVVVPEGINTVNANAMKGTKDKLRLLVLPLSLTRIDRDAFKDLPNLEEVRFSDNLTHIGPSAFANCPKLKTITFPSSLEKIDNSAFKGCTSLTKVKIPKNCTYTQGNKYFNSFPDTCEIISE